MEVLAVDEDKARSLLADAKGFEQIAVEMFFSSQSEPPPHTPSTKLGVSQTPAPPFTQNEGAVQGWSRILNAAASEAPRNTPGRARSKLLFRHGAVEVAAVSEGESMERYLEDAYDRDTTATSAVKWIKRRPEYDKELDHLATTLTLALTLNPNHNPRPHIAH